jgi:hypothetical protein
MHLISAPEFLSKFGEGQSVVFVGNAPSLKGEQLGKWIEAHDIIVRFNEAPISGYEIDVGRRTDILITNPYPENRRDFELSPHGAVLLISPQTKRPFSTTLETWLGDRSVLFTYAPDIVGIGGIDHKASLTTGTYGVHLLSRLLLPARVSITGFTMFMHDTSQHYWRDLTPKGISAHDLNVEAHVFLSICNSMRCSLEVTSEIQWFARLLNTNLREAIRIKPLADPKWVS